jgi:uncharacterized lipoprotein YmbA
MRRLPIANSITLFRVLVAASLLTLGGCAAKGPPPTMYVLDSAAPTLLPTFEKGLVVGLGPVEVAPYLNRNQIVTRETSSRLELSEQHQWAEPLKDGFSRVLLVNLGVSLNSNQVYILPLRKRRALDYEVPVDILRFDGELGKVAIVGARWSVVDGKADRILKTQVSIIREPVADKSYEAFVTAQSRAMAQLGKEIAAALEEYSASRPDH